MATLAFAPNKDLTEETNVKDVAYELGRLAQEDSIVFTKASLIKFLQTQGVEVDMNFSNLRRLPKYAKFGKMTTGQAPATPAPVASSTPAAPASFITAAPTQPPVTAAGPVSSIAAPASQARAPQTTATEPPPIMSNPDVVMPDGESFRPTRRVREAIGGGSNQIASLFGGPEDKPAPKPSSASPAASEAPQNDNAAPAAPTRTTLAAADSSANTAPSKSKAAEEPKPQSNFRPTRRVREAIGGGSEQISNLFGGGESNDDTASVRRR